MGTIPGKNVRRGDYEAIDRPVLPKSLFQDSAIKVVGKRPCLVTQPGRSNDQGLTSPECCSWDIDMRTAIQLRSRDALRHLFKARAIAVINCGQRRPGDISHHMPIIQRLGIKWSSGVSGAVCATGAGLPGHPVVGRSDCFQAKPASKL